MDRSDCLEPQFPHLCNGDSNTDLEWLLYEQMRQYLQNSWLSPPSPPQIGLSKWWWASWGESWPVLGALGPGELFQTKLSQQWLPLLPVNQFRVKLGRRVPWISSMELWPGMLHRMVDGRDSSSWPWRLWRGREESKNEEAPPTPNCSAHPHTPRKTNITFVVSLKFSDYLCHPHLLMSAERSRR